MSSINQAARVNPKFIAFVVAATIVPFLDHRAELRSCCMQKSRVLLRGVSRRSRGATLRLARMDVALGPRERNRRRTRDARRRPVAAKSQSKLPHRAHAARRREHVAIAR